MHSARSFERWIAPAEVLVVYDMLAHVTINGGGPATVHKCFCISARHTGSRAGHAENTGVLSDSDSWKRRIFSLHPRSICIQCIPRNPCVQEMWRAVNIPSGLNRSLHLDLYVFNLLRRRRTSVGSLACHNGRFLQCLTCDVCGHWV